MVDQNKNFEKNDNDDEKIDKILKDIGDIKCIVLDLNHILISQNEKLDLIDEKIEKSNDYVLNATHEIKKIDKKKKNKNTIKTILIGSALTLPVGFLFGPLGIGVGIISTSVATIAQRI